MNYSLIRNCDIANGPGVRVSLFVSGCTHHCPGCFQPETWDFNYGKKFTDETIWEILRLLEPNYIDGLTVLGGEPLDERNMDDVWALLNVVRRMGSPEKTVWLYTGSTLEQLRARPCQYGQLTKDILNKVDILVDGSEKNGRDWKNRSVERGDMNEHVNYRCCCLFHSRCLLCD